MEIKDTVSLSISIVAFGFSIFATIYSNIKSTENKQRTIREQLTSILDKLQSSKIDEIKLTLSSNNPVILGQINAQTRQKAMFLIEEAKFLCQKIPDLMQPFELNTLAASCAEVGDAISAEDYYIKSIEKSSNDRERAITKASYASILFQTGRTDSGRTTLQDAIIIIPGEDDLSKQQRGNISKLWATYECDFTRSFDLCRKHLLDAQSEYLSMNDTPIKHQCLASLTHLETVISKIKQEQTVITPPPAPRSPGTSS